VAKEETILGAIQIIRDTYLAYFRPLLPHVSYGDASSESKIIDKNLRQKTKYQIKFLTTKFEEKCSNNDKNYQVVNFLKFKDCAIFFKINLFCKNYSIILIYLKE